MKFKVGDKVKCIKMDNRWGAKENLKVGEVYVIKLLVFTDLLVLVDTENPTYSWNSCCFELYEEPLPTQDNEFVKMMCSNERMLDLIL